MKKSFKILGIILLVVVLSAAGAVSYVKMAMPNVGDAPQLSVERTPERIKRGEYLAHNVMLCMDCHGKRDYTLYGAPPVPGTEGSG